MLRCCLLLLLLQDPPLVERLGDPDPRVREEATKALAAKGPAAREELLAARKNRDQEIRDRALELLCRFDPTILLQTLQTSQRGRKLGLLAATQTDLPPGVAVTDGVRYRFTRRAWAPDGQVLGTVVETQAEQVLEGDLRWTVAAVRNGGDLPVETCSLHSPRLVYVPGVPPAECTVVVRGNRTWRCDVPVRFEAPAEGSVRRVGAFTMTLEWPQLVLRSDAEVAQSMLDGGVLGSEIEVVLKPGRNAAGFRSRVNLIASTCCGVGRKPVRPAWCGCEGKPYKATDYPPPAGRALRVTIALGQVYKVDDVASLSFPFHMPVEEAFEVESPPLK